MGNGTIGWITALLRLPVFYNPDAAGYRAPVEDDKFLDTADELAHRQTRRSRANGCEPTRAAFCGNDSGRRPSI